METMSTNEQRELAENQAQAEAHMHEFSELGKMLNVPYEDHGNYTDERIEQATDDLSNGLLAIEVKRTVHIVLGTGGPHTELQWPEDGKPSVVCYGWFGAGRFERKLTDDEITGLEAVVGDWDSLIESQS